MKKIALILMAVLPAALFAQTPDNYTVISKVGTLTTPARAYMIHNVGGKNLIDSVNIVNGGFVFHGNVAEPTGAVIVIDAKGVGIRNLDRSSDALSFYLDESNISINSPDSISKAVITGSKTNEDNLRLKGVLKPIAAKAKTVLDEAQNANDAQKIDPFFQNAIQAKYKVVQDEQEAAMKKFIADNPDSFISLAALGSISGPTADLDQEEHYFNLLSPRLKKLPSAKNFRDSFEALKLVAVGAMAPDFTEPDTSGVPVKLSSFRGKYVLIDFWASWCAPCRQENPNVVKAYTTYKSKNFTVLGVSLDKPGDRASWVKAIKDDGLTWSHVSDLKYWNSDVASLYRVSSIPQNYLIGPDGRIVAKGLRGTDLEKKLAEIFKM